MTQISMSSFPMPKTAAFATMTDTRSVHIISMKATRETGRSAKNVGRISKRKCTSGTGQTSSISKNWRIPPNTNPRGVQSVEISSSSAKTDIAKKVSNIFVKIAQDLNCEMVIETEGLSKEDLD